MRRQLDELKTECAQGDVDGRRAVAAFADAVSNDSMKEAYRRFPQIGFNRRARLIIQPGPHRLLHTFEVCDEVAGARNVRKP